MCRLGSTPYRVAVEVAPRSEQSPALTTGFLWCSLAALAPEQIPVSFPSASLQAPAPERATAVAYWRSPWRIRASVRVSALDWLSAFVGARGNSRRGRRSRPSKEQLLRPQANASFLPGSAPPDPAARNRRLLDQ